MCLARRQRRPPPEETAEAAVERAEPPERRRHRCLPRVLDGACGPSEGRRARAVDRGAVRQARRGSGPALDVAAGRRQPGPRRGHLKLLDQRDADMDATQAVVDGLRHRAANAEARMATLEAAAGRAGGEANERERACPHATDRRRGGGRGGRGDGRAEADRGPVPRNARGLPRPRRAGRGGPSPDARPGAGSFLPREIGGDAGSLQRWSHQAQPNGYRIADRSGLSEGARRSNRGVPMRELLIVAVALWAGSATLAQEPSAPVEPPRSAACRGDRGR